MIYGALDGMVCHDDDTTVGLGLGYFYPLGFVREWGPFYINVLH